MSNNKQHINHLTPQQMEDYAANRLSDEQMHLVEKHMLQCAFCEAAVEGLTENGLPFGFHDDVEILKTRIENRAQENRKKIIPFWQLGIAASVLVIIGVGSFLIFGGKSQNSEIKLTQKKTETKQEEVQKPVEDTTRSEEIKLIDSTNVSDAPTKPHSFLVADNNIFSKKSNDNLPSSTSNQASYSAPVKAISDADVFTLKESDMVEEVAFADVAEETMEDAEVVQEDVEEISLDNNVQLYRISGKVQSTTGEPIPFANVLDLTDNSGTVTDFEGNFILNSKVDSPKLKVNYVGFKSEELIAVAEKPVNITLQEDAIALNEVQVISSNSIKNVTKSLNVTSDILQIEKSEKTVILPEPVDGYQAYNKYIKANAKLTEEAKANNISGVVTLSFKIDSDGKPKSIKVIKSLGFGLDEQLINLIENGPKWTTTSNERVEYGFEFKLD